MITVEIWQNGQLKGYLTDRPEIVRNYLHTLDWARRHGMRNPVYGIIASNGLRN